MPILALFTSSYNSVGTGARLGIPTLPDVLRSSSDDSGGSRAAVRAISFGLIVFVFLHPPVTP